MSGGVFFVTFAAMIQELPIHDGLKAYYNEPLLEYSIQTANRFWRYYDKKMRIMQASHVIEDFCKRYHDGKIKKLQDIQIKYLEASEVQETLKTYGLDVSKFWYLCILVKDFAEGQTIESSTENPTHREELQMLISELEKLTPNKSFIDKICRFEPATPVNKPAAQQNLIKTEVEGCLTLKIDGNKKIAINDGQTLVLLREALSLFLNRMPRGNNSYLDSAPPFPYNATLLGVQFRVAIFYECMMWFLDQYKPDVKQYLSIDRRLLISRLIYVFEIDNDPRYYDKDDLHTVEGKISFLKNKIKRIRGVNLPTKNKYYNLQDD